jgi:transcriptional regulator with XRE-family HTH domain
MPDVSSLAKKLKRLREEAGLSQQALAVAAGLSTGVVSRIEQGQKSDVLLSTAAALARALGITVDSLAEPTSAEPPAKPKRNGKKKGS